MKTWRLKGPPSVVCEGGRKQMFERDVTWRAFAPCHICNPV